MSTHYLSPLFAPRSVAVIGASDTPGTAGAVVYRNLVDGGFHGAVHAVNPAHAEVFGSPCLPSIDEVDGPVDLAVIVAPAEECPALIEACGRHHVPAAIVISSGFADDGSRGSRLQKQLMANAAHHRVRVLGPNCFGVMRPCIGLNATYSVVAAIRGNVALVSQSGALCGAILDWSQSNQVAFSSVISLGDAADVDFGEILDYLVADPQTESILLYVEGIRDARGFMSALRAAARTKPVIVAKVGRHGAGRQAAITHSGALVGTDDVFDAALRRAGAVRVRTVVQLFSAAKCLSSRFRPCGDRLAIVTNGGGPGVMAADWAADVGIRVARLTDSTVERLNRALPPNWSHSNPVDLLGDAPAERYREAIAACLEDPEVDGVLVVLTPQANTRPDEVAHAVVKLAEGTRKPLISTWMGDEHVEASRAILTRAKLPVFRTPEPAVESFSHIVTYYRNQQLLLQVPGPLVHEEPPDRDSARILIESVLAEKRTVLSEMESKALLSAFHIPVAQTVVARTVNEAIVIASQLGFPLAMKINSPDVTHKSDVGGVRLNVGSAQAVREAFGEIVAQVRTALPEARIDGVAIQPMSRKPYGRELMVGVTTDQVFGPVITFGMGGSAVSVIGDRAVALPPLNAFLARDLVGRTRASRMLGRFRNMPEVDMAAVEGVLLRVSEMVCELPWLREMDINPLIVDDRGALAVDARVVVDYPPLSARDRYAHVAICPYPSHLQKLQLLPDGTALTIRPIRPEDAAMEAAFVRDLSEESKYFRFMDTVAELTPQMLARFTQIDYDREMALVAVSREGAAEAIVGVARYSINPDGESCEFALVVADAWQGRGVGSRLMLALQDAAREKELTAIEGDVLANNANMLRLMNSLGYAVSTSRDDPSVRRVVKTL